VIDKILYNFQYSGLILYGRSGKDYYFINT